MDARINQGCRSAAIASLLAMTLISGCATSVSKSAGPTGPQGAGPTLTPESQTHRHLVALPEPAAKITVSVYGFRDQTGQYKPPPSNAFSTAVTQGAGSMLVKALLDSKWFVPLEREGLQDLLTERKILRAARQNSGNGNDVRPLLTSDMLLGGGIVAYETNVMTGGSGARYLGVGGSDEYRVDQVTVNLRVVDARSGQILASVSTTSTIFSRRLDVGIFRFVRFREVFEAETGFSRNEPVQLFVNEAIESAVIHLIARGIRGKVWRLKRADDIRSEVIRSYL